MRGRVRLRLEAFASWMVERCLPGGYAEAVSGDLLEQLHSGRSDGWYWRQAGAAVGMGLARRSGRLLLPLAYTLAWGSIYPAWAVPIRRSVPLQLMLSRWSTLDWPYSAVAAVGSAFLPAATYMWLGFLMYVAFYTKGADRPTPFRIFCSLSLGLNVLLVVTMACLGWPGPFGGSSCAPVCGAASVSPRDLVPSAPMVLSLFTAILFALPRAGGRQGARSLRT